MEIFTYILSLLSIIGTTLPKNDSKHWIVRSQANFRAVYFFLNSACVMLVFFFISNIVAIASLVVILLVCIYICGRSIYPYTGFVVKTIADGDPTSKKLISVFIHNVYQYNDRCADLVVQIKSKSPDVILLLETDSKWAEGTSELRALYPYLVEEVRDDTYGIIMMSRIEPELSQVHHFVYEDTPATEMLLDVHGSQLRVLGIHPKPPVVGEAKTSIPKEKEIRSAAQYLKSQGDKEYQLLIGDLNDVAWSDSAVEFKNITGMQDPREGRGFYATFPAYFPIRIPLDHVFCSPDMKLVAFERLDNAGSDHYAVSVVFEMP